MESDVIVINNIDVVTIIYHQVCPHAAALHWNNGLLGWAAATL